MKTEKLMEYIQSYLEEMPFYVNEYYRSKIVQGRSQKTLYEYLKEYKRFFSWLIEADLTSADTIKDIQLDTLANLSKKDMESFIVYLRERNLLNNSAQAKNKTLSEKTISRTLISLSSLFNYLTIESEDEHGQPYFDRNVMKKIKLSKKTQTLQARAASMKSQWFLGDQTQAFIDFIEFEYPKKISNRALASYNINKERDLAIISLFLATGIRLSEATNTNLTDLNLNDLTVNVVRKGGENDTVSIAPLAKRYLKEYLEIREKRYKVGKSLSKEEKANIKDSKERLDTERALFLSIQSGVPRRLGSAAIERTVSKYSECFGIRVTPHKLRHTLATRLYGATKDPVLLAHQLGHRGGNTQSVTTYAHILNDDTQRALHDL